MGQNYIFSLIALNGRVILGKAHTVFLPSFSLFTKRGKAPSANVAHRGWADQIPWAPCKLKVQFYLRRVESISEKCEALHSSNSP